jgi:hypothetical protein
MRDCIELRVAIINCQVHLALQGPEWAAVQTFDELILNGSIARSTDSVSLSTKQQ